MRFCPFWLRVSIPAALLIASGGARAGEVWKPIRGDSGRIQVSLPGAVTKNTQTFENQGEKGTLEVYKASASPGLFFNVVLIRYGEGVLRGMRLDPVKFQADLMASGMRKKPGSKQEPSPPLKVPKGASSALSAVSASRFRQAGAVGGR